MPRYKLLICLCFSLLLAGCSAKVLDDPARLSGVKAHIHNSGKAPYWSGSPTRVTAYIQPESMSLFSVLSVSFSFQSIYRTYPDGTTKFVMFMPQGTRLGSCERTPAGSLSCTGMPLPAVSDMLNHSFLAIDSLLAVAPEDSDKWQLQYGDMLGGVDSSELVLARTRAKDSGGEMVSLYSLEGEPEVVYEYEKGSVLWKMLFSRPSGKESVAFYRYKNRDSKWIFNVNILGIE